MFDPNYSKRFEAITAVVDLEGFSPFTTQPDNHRKLARFLNFVFERVNESLDAASISQSWTHRKFLGDGALYIWAVELNNAQTLGSQIFLAFYNLFRTYPSEILTHNDEELSVRSVPKRIRVGIAQGEVTELKTKDASMEYVGFSINLAARLQHYCPEIGFLISCSVPLPPEFVESHSLTRARTKMIRGMPNLDEDIRFVKQDGDVLGRKGLEKWFTLSKEA